MLFTRYWTEKGMNDTVGVIGAGVIGSAIVKSLLKSNYKGKIIEWRMSFIERNSEKRCWRSEA